MKRIIDGKTYNTETSAKIFDYNGLDLDPTDQNGVLWGQVLYQTRHGAYFVYKYYDDLDGKDTIQPFSPTEAQTWLEEIQHTDVTNIIEQHFGEMPEAGELESRITLRMPDSLKNKIDAFAQRNHQSTNAWIVKMLEKAIAYERG